jgi:hypothetical protein
METGMIKKENQEIAINDTEASVFAKNFATVITDAAAVATELVKLLEPDTKSNRPAAYVVIGSNKHVKAEGWTTMGGMIKVFPHLENEPIWLNDNQDCRAVIVLKTLDGQICGRASAICSFTEQEPDKIWSETYKKKINQKNPDGTIKMKARWADRYAVESMAQTRAIGKAFRDSFSWIMRLAGYSPTPAEEMTETMAQEINKTEVPAKEAVKTAEGVKQQPEPSADYTLDVSPLYGSADRVDVVCAEIMNMSRRGKATLTVFSVSDGAKKAEIQVWDKEVEGVKTPITDLMHLEKGVFVKFENLTMKIYMEKKQWTAKKLTIIEAKE